MTKEAMDNILIVVPTYNGLSDLQRLIASLPQDGYDLFVIDSSSTDGTAGYLASQGIDHQVIRKDEFNHGGTRQRVIGERPGYDIYIYLTQDAYLAAPDAIDKLLKYFNDSDVGAVCGRQLAHHDANPLAEHARMFNYPAQSCVKSLADVPHLGIKTAFMSNSFAAYRKQALQDVGGFPTHVILAEDMYVAARMLQKGWKVAYAGDACCYHSHNYTPWQEFKRYFDTGVFHHREGWIQRSFGGVGGEGLAYVKSELASLGGSRVRWGVQALLANGMKLVGYKLGKRESCLPQALKKRLSMHRGYWLS